MGPAFKHAGKQGGLEDSYPGSMPRITDYEFYGAVLGSGWGEGFPCELGFETASGGSVHSGVVPAGALRFAI